MCRCRKNGHHILFTKEEFRDYFTSTFYESTCNSKEDVKRYARTIGKLRRHLNDKCKCKHGHQILLTQRELKELYWKKNQDYFKIKYGYPSMKRRGAKRTLKKLARHLNIKWTNDGRVHLKE